MWFFFIQRTQLPRNNCVMICVISLFSNLSANVKHFIHCISGMPTLRISDSRWFFTSNITELRTYTDPYVPYKPNSTCSSSHLFLPAYRSIFRSKRDGICLWNGADNAIWYMHSIIILYMGMRQREIYKRLLFYS